VLDAPLEDAPFLGPIKRVLPSRLKTAAREGWRELSFRRHMTRLLRCPSLLADTDFLASIGEAWGNSGYRADVAFLLEALARVRNGAGAGSVLECGSGLSTVLIGLAMSAGSAEDKIWALENDEYWLQRVAHVSQTYRLRNVQLIHAPLQRYGDYTWYAPPLARMPRFQLVICDGPIQATPGGRYGLLPVMAAHLAHDAVVLLDDADTESGRGVLARWQAEGRACVELRESTHGTFAILTARGPLEP
jgi:hypothetical protein